MTEDEINKAETLLGYVTAMYGDLDFFQKNRYHFIPDLIEEAEEWILELRSQDHQAVTELTDAQADGVRNLTTASSEHEASKKASPTNKLKEK